MLSVNVISHSFSKIPLLSSSEFGHSMRSIFDLFRVLFGDIKDCNFQQYLCIYIYKLIKLQSMCLFFYKNNKPNLLVLNLRKFINFPKVGFESDELLNYLYIYMYIYGILSLPLDYYSFFIS